MSTKGEVKKAVLRRLPAAPKHLTPDEREAWRKIGGEAVAAGTLTAEDLSMLELAAQTQAQLRKARKNKRVPLTSVTAASRLLLDLLRQLGLTPAARKSVPHVPPAPEPGEDPLDGY